MNSDDLFQDLELSEPSAAVRRRVLAAASVGAGMVHRQGRRKWYALAGLAAGVMVGVGITLWLPSREPTSLRQVVSDQPPRPVSTLGASSGSTTSSSRIEPLGGIAAMQTALTELRADMKQLGKDLALVPEERELERGEIQQRLQAALATLERLEMQVENERATENENERSPEEGDQQ